MRMPTGDIIVTVAAAEDRLDADTLIKALRELLVAISYSGETLKDWEIVKVSMNSPVRARVRSRNSTPGVRELVRRVDRFARGGRTRGRLRYDDIDRINRISALFKPSGGVSRIEINAGARAKTVLTEERIATALSHSPPAPQSFREELEEIEGYLTSVTVEADRHAFRLRERIQQRAIDCTFDASLLGKVKEALPHRVMVTGHVRYNPAGEITSIKVLNLVKLKQGFIPYDQWKGVDLTGGVDSVTFIRRIRGEE